MNTYAIVLAAGKGTRMKSDKPKVIHEVMFEPMVKKINNELRKVIKNNNFLFIAGYKSDEVISTLDKNSNVIIQKKQLGTGHAIKSAKNFFKDKKGYVLIISGDTPLFKSETLKEILKQAKKEKSDLVVASALLDDPTGYGRIIKDENNQIAKIVEQKDATATEKKVKEINSGIYLIDIQKLFKHINKIKNNNNQKEYYLTDIIEIFIKNNLKVSSFLIEDTDQIIGVNDLYNLSIVNEINKLEINKKLLQDGVMIFNPNTTYISSDSIIEPGVELFGNIKIISSHIKTGSIIENSTIENSTISEKVKITNSNIYDSKIDEQTTIGPFAHIRNVTHIGKHNRIGNFVEIKNTKTGKNTNLSHLSYTGDAQIGSHVNMGCHTVTVNYDGVNKNKTKIGDNSFIGCHVNLIAPINVGNNTVIAAGSVIKKNVPNGALVISRPKEEKVIKNYGKNFHKKVLESKNDNKK